jgi:hypothetical protein
MFGEMLDTTVEGKRFYFQSLARLTPTERLALMDESSRLMRAVCEAAIRKDFPDITPQQLRARLAVRLFRREVVERVLGSLADGAR